MHEKVIRCFTSLVPSFQANICAANNFFFYRQKKKEKNVTLYIQKLALFIVKGFLKILANRSEKYSTIHVALEKL